MFALLLAAGCLSACGDTRSAPAAEHATRPLDDAELRAQAALLAQLDTTLQAPVDAAAVARLIDPSALLTLAGVTPPPAPAAPALVDLQRGQRGHQARARRWAPRADTALPRFASRGCVLSSDDSITLAECAIGPHVVEGSWSRRPDGAHVELTDVFVTSHDQHGSLWLDSRLSARLGAGDEQLVELDGALEVSVTWSVAGRDHSVDVSVAIEQLVLAYSSPAPPLAHSLRCVYSGRVSIDSAQLTAPNTHTTLWFGPGCGEVSLARTSE
ncbi:MAG: hypothetical protein Tsb0020_25500 [Haliangiales bacterium]